MSLIASRSPELPDLVAVMAAAEKLDLLAIQDEWYQDVSPEAIAQLLREGTTWVQDGATDGGRWALSGRELYVLAERMDISGWVSQPSLELGRKHAILCTEQFRPAAEEAIRAAGASPAKALDASLGAPVGWVVLPDVIPTRPVSPRSEADLLNALRPLPHVDIALEGGIRLEHASWLEGYPPTIRVYGKPAHTTEVLIDGGIASWHDGAYRVPGWDSLGSHGVWCEGTSSSYSIVPFEASWQSWDAYSFPADSDPGRRLSICGPLVHEASGDVEGWTPAIQLPPTHTVILGAVPGEYATATRASAILGAPYLASAGFCAVWALPRDPLHSNKTSVRILLVGDAAQPRMAVSHLASARQPNVMTWCGLILAASRKGLATEPGTEDVRALWLRYRLAARQIWRASRRA